MRKITTRSGGKIMSAKCGPNKLCPRPAARWWKKTLAVDWFDTGGVSEQATALFAKGTGAGYTIPNAAGQTLVDNFYKGLIDGGDYTEIDVMWLFNSYGDHDFSCLNLIDPNSFECTENGTLTFVPSLGFNGSTNGYLNSGWIPSTHAVKYALNSASAFFYVDEDTKEVTRIFGSANVGNTNRIESIVGNTDFTLTALLNSSTVASFFEIWTTRGFYHLIKTSTTNIDIYRNGILLGSVTIANTALPNVAMYALARNAAGTAGSFSTNTIGILGFGSANIDPVNLYNQWATYRGGTPSTGFRRIMSSTNGTAWTTRTITDNGWKDVAYSPSLGLFVAVAEHANGTNNRVATSPDGITWTVRAAGGDNKWIGVCWSPELALFCAVALSGTNRVITSPDGINWTSRTTIDTEQWVHIAWSPELLLFCAVSETSGTSNIMTSPDGITWTQRAAPATISLRGLCWSPELDLFCASSFTGPMLTSPDGITWTERTSSLTQQWAAVDWSPTLNLFAAVANSGAGNRIQTSPDGITWTLRAFGSGSNWRAVTWSPTLSLFVAVCDNQSAAFSVITSPDGITWTVRTGAANDFNGIIEGNGVLVAVAAGEN